MTSNERAFVISLIQEYTKIYSLINRYESELDKMEAIPHKIVESNFRDLELKLKIECERLSAFRSVEEEFWKEINNKYGPGDFDPVELEYKVKEL